MKSIRVCSNGHDAVAYLGDSLADTGSGCPLCRVFEAAKRLKEGSDEDAPSDDKTVEAMRKIRAVINGRGDSVTKVLKCKDILAYMGI
jgi:hypothetical protein